MSSFQVRQNVFGSRRDCHRIVSIDRVALEVRRKSSSNELVEHTSLIDSQIGLNFGKAPVSEIAWVIVDSIKSVAANKADSIRKNDSGYSVGGTDADTGRHWSPKF